MEANSSLDIFPRKHIKPYDGMSVTANVWEQAHGEHRQTDQAHNLFFHGAGIVTGLEVVASDPPDRYVFISPGVAVDQAGNVIVLTEPVAYDFGNNVEGTLYLMLGHGTREAGGVNKDEKFLHDEFVIAARLAVPKRPAVELARITLDGPNKPIQNARQLAHPKNGELDLRFRSAIMTTSRRLVRIGLIGLGNEAPQVVSGWEFLARACQQLSSYMLIVDDGLTLETDLATYDLVFISGSGSFKLNAGQQKSLREYLETGRGLFCDALDKAADTSFNAVFEKLGRALAPLAAGDELLSTPFLFNVPPSGASQAQVLRDKQIIYSNAGYSLAWAGKMPTEHNTRADIRSAHEWGINIIHHCLSQVG